MLNYIAISILLLASEAAINLSGKSFCQAKKDDSTILYEQLIAGTKKEYEEAVLALRKDPSTIFPLIKMELKKDSSDLLAKEFDKHEKSIWRIEQFLNSIDDKEIPLLLDLLKDNSPCETVILCLKRLGYYPEKSKDYISVIHEYLRNADADIREQALETLNKFADPSTVSILLDLFRKTKHHKERAEIARSFQFYTRASKKLSPEILGLLRNETNLKPLNEDACQFLAYSLTSMQAEAFPLILEELSNKNINSSLIYHLVQSLSDMGQESHRHPDVKLLLMRDTGKLAFLLNNNDEDIRVTLLQMFERAESQSKDLFDRLAAIALKPLNAEVQPSERFRALAALISCSPWDERIPAIFDSILSATKENLEIRKDVARLIYSYISKYYEKRKIFVHILKTILSDSDPAIRSSAILTAKKCMGRYDSEFTELLTAMKDKDTDEKVRTEASECLEYWKTH